MKNKNLNYKANPALPKLPNYQTKWDLAGLFYKGDNDPRLEKDVRAAEAGWRKFAKKYQNGDWRKNATSVLAALESYLALESIPGSRPLYYFSYRQQLNAADTFAERSLNKLSERLTKAANELLFFPLQLAKLPKALQKELLADSKAAKYRWYLKGVFEDARYQLSELEEKVLNLKSLTSRSLWVSGTEKIVNKKSIEWKGKPMPIHGALMQFEHLPMDERHKMWQKIKQVLEGVGEVAENELVALVLDKKTDDDLRGYQKPYSATTRGYDSNDKTLETLVSVMETRGYALSRKFFALKKKLLKKKLTYIDRNEPVGKEPSIPLNMAIDICRDAFYDFDPLYGDFFDTMLKKGQIDVWPKAGKGGGAFCSSGTNQPTLVFLNHNDSLESLRTLAHEMGHAIHAFCSKRQPVYYEGHSILTAETASTFFESLVMERLMKVVSPDEKIAILNGMIGDRIGTMIMCIARFKFELEMHETIRREGGMTWQEMSAALAKHFADYTGPAVETLPEHGLIVLCKPHYRMNFYQYSYSFGEIGSSIVRARYNKDRTYATKVDRFLSAGESDSVEAIFKSIGIDMAKAETYNQGLSLLEADIKAFEKLVDKK
jgi:oligoendopeptidase F